MDTILLESRRKEILGVIISAYSETAQPVSSKYLCQRYKIKLSSATIRNAMADLEKQDLITHPHTSAGRIPTDKGYYYYIQTLLAEEEADSLGDLASYCAQMKGFFNLEEVIREASRVLANLTHQASLAISPTWGRSIFKRVELITLEPDKILMVIVNRAGMLKSFMLSLSEKMAKKELEQISYFLNSELQGMQLQEIESFLSRKLLTVEGSLFYLFKEARELIHKTYIRLLDEEIFLEGTQYIFEQPELFKAGKIKALLEIVEEKKKILEILQKDLEQDEDKVNVRIGRDGLGEELEDLSMVSRNYKISNFACGSLAVLGPKRMAYPKIISAVSSMSKAVSSVLTDLCEK